MLNDVILLLCLLLQGVFMAYFNRDYKTLSLGDMEYLNSGACAEVLYNGDIIFKRYYPETLSECKLDAKMFDMLKTIDNPHFIKLLDIYQDCNFNEMVKHFIGLLPFAVDAYTAKYYSDNSIDVLLESKDYILENFRELELLFNIFTENRICVCDLKRDNSIIGKQGIVVIDPDLFYIASYPIENISRVNKERLLAFFRNIIYHFLVKHKENYIKNRMILDSILVNFYVDSDTDVTSELSNKMKQIKRPIEIFKR